MTNRYRPQPTVGLLADRVGAAEVAIERASDRLANGRRPADM